ncbi:MAG: phosphatidylserine decarboxylase [Bacteriovoracaceae bacterium]|nr:phosphatidylserine decarboxylase [Bacteriovoracaceae bacterium]
MSEDFHIKYVNRTTGQLGKEKIYGFKAVRWLYQSSLGKFFAAFLVQKWLSFLYGLWQNTVFSRRKVAPFIRDFSINMNEFQPGSYAQNKIEDSYKSFNEFFIRRFKPGQRNFVSNGSLPAVAEARYVGYEEINPTISFPVKGKFLTLAQLLRPEDQKIFNGAFLIARLCPVDYHRYHYPDDGTVERSYTLSGELHSVNPLALALKPDIFLKNEKRVAILNTKNFGKLAYIEVGAICVGKIVQSHDESKAFQRGDEKGYFLFGGSTVILIGQKGQWCPSLDILKNTKAGIETYIQLGDVIGTKS